ncbi:MAG TPA: hypothetical protein VGJ60_07065 [Chloroflexota bacterium]
MTEPALNETEYLALVERIQQAMCIEPFRPDVADVIVLIGTCRALNDEIERLRAERDEARTNFANSEIATLIQIRQVRAENERLRAMIDEIAAEDDE